MNKKYTFNTNYFHQPTIKNSYWAGFIAADGCLFTASGSKALKIKLQNRDYEHLVKFQNEIKYNGPILFDGNQPYLRVYGADQFHIDLLRNFNIIPNKSLTLKSPNITSNKFIKSFIIGYIDGDGCISRYKSSRDGWITEINICGTYEIISWIRNYLKNIIKCQWNDKVKKQGNIYVISYKNSKGEKIIRHLLQLKNIDSFRLQRKWNILLNTSNKKKLV